MKTLISTILISLIIVSCSKDEPQSDNTEVMTDIDGNPYATIEITARPSSVIITASNCQIGSQVWTLQNLGVTRYRNGDPIPQITDGIAWANTTSGAWCYYANNTANGLVYGKLYNWYAVTDPRGLAPAGWHIPSKDEWTALVTYLGGWSVAGGKMKNITGWQLPNSGATNESGFTGIPGGYRMPYGNFANMGSIGYWWSTTALNGASSWFAPLLYSNDSCIITSDDKRVGLFVRCIKD